MSCVSGRMDQIEIVNRFDTPCSVPFELLNNILNLIRTLYVPCSCFSSASFSLELTLASEGVGDDFGSSRRSLFVGLPEVLLPGLPNRGGGVDSRPTSCSCCSRSLLHLRLDMLFRIARIWSASIWEWSALSLLSRL